MDVCHATLTYKDCRALYGAHRMHSQAVAMTENDWISDSMEPIQ